VRAASRPPELPRLSEDDPDAAPVTVLQNDAFVIGAAVAGADLSSQRAESLSLTDVEFTRCNLANVQTPRARMSRVAISDSRLTGATLTESQLRDVTIRGCRADLTSFGFSRLERVTFEDCVLSGADFLEARLDSVRFNGCDLFEADIRGARLTACELRACRLDGLQGVANLAGAAMEWPAIVEMAGAWAAELGIEVLE
jgi:uncharacterized protein YjbI with pentapeptide repeats